MCSVLGIQRAAPCRSSASRREAEQQRRWSEAERGLWRATEPRREAALAGTAGLCPGNRKRSRGREDVTRGEGGTLPEEWMSAPQKPALCSWGTVGSPQWRQR